MIDRSCRASVAILVLATVVCSVPAAAVPDDLGVLVMAHGGSPEWNAGVESVVAPLRDDYRVEIAFGMADPESMQRAVAALEARGARKIVVVRLFVSGESWYERTEKILGIRNGAPPRPPADGHDAEPHDGAAGRHSMALWRVDTESRFALSTQGLAEAPEVESIVADRIERLSKRPAEEDVLVLAHGPQDDAENERWIAHIEARIEDLMRTASFRKLQVMTLREDERDKREAAEEQIRSFVEEASSNGTAIVVPFRVHGFGPYADVLEGLDYAADGNGLIPHPAVTAWVERQIHELAAGAFRPVITPINR